MSPAAMAVLACISVLAGMVIIETGLRRTPAQTAALAALAHRRELLADTGRAAAANGVDADAAGNTGSTGSGGGSGSSGAASSAPSTGGDAGGGSGDTSGAAVAGGGSAASGSSSSASGSSSSGSSNTGKSSAPPDAGLPRVGHVFLITLSTPSYAAVFGDGSQAPYLRSLVSKGVLLSDFRSLGRGELADELAMVSGQAPNRDTSRGCPTFREFAASANANHAGDVPGEGCVYPESALTIGDQVTADGKTWSAYIADMGSTTCQHPNSDAATDVAVSGTDPGYDLQHNPFVFFHSLLDDGSCQADDVDLSKLTQALSVRSRTPMFTYVGADACADGDPLSAPSDTSSSSTTTTAGTTTSATTTTTATTGTSSTQTTSTTTSGYGCPAGDPSGISAEDAFLKQWVPEITQSAAYRRNGVLVIAFAGSDSAAHPFRTGALVLSRFKSRPKRIDRTYGPYSLLHSLEDMLDQTPLAHAARAPAFAKAAL